MKRKIKSIQILFVTIGLLSLVVLGCTSEKKEEIPPTAPTVTTDEVYNIGYTNAEVRATIVSTGGADLNQSGFCWSLTPSPKITDNLSTEGAASGSFRTNITTLEEGTTYYIRAFAGNSVGITYGNELTFSTNLSCQTMVARHPGYQVWAGDTPYFQELNSGDYFYSIDKYGYKLIGESTTTQTFNTGNYKYYVIVAKYWCFIDAIQFNDGSYYAHGQGYTLIGGMGDDRIIGAPDGIYGKFGGLCPPEGKVTFSGFITDNATITSRGGGLKVIVGQGSL